MPEGSFRHLLLWVLWRPDW